jgi:adenylate kinase family enzyme
MKKDNYTGKLTKDIINSGELLPEFLPIWMWSDFLIDNFKTGKENLILDGLARRVDEAPVLDKALKFYNRRKPEVIILNVSHEWGVERLLKRGRHDDHEEHIKKRIEWYDTNVVPTIEFFRNNPDYTVHEINGEQTIEEVHEEIIKKING